MERNDIYFMDEFDKQFSSALLRSFYDVSFSALFIVYFFLFNFFPYFDGQDKCCWFVGPLIMYCWYPRTILTMYFCVPFFERPQVLIYNLGERLSAYFM